MSDLTEAGRQARERVLERYPDAMHWISMYNGDHLIRANGNIETDIIGRGHDESSAWTSTQEQIERG